MGVAWTAGAGADVLRVPNSALRFAPTPELFAALGQEAPQQLAGAGGRGVVGAAGTAGQAAGESNRQAEGRGRFAQLTPEERAQFAARFTPEQRAQFAQMTPEERAQFRLAQRSSQSDGAPRGLAGDPPAGRAGGISGATGFGRVWALREGKLQLVRVRTGVTDGANTAIVGGELKEGDRVVTGITEPGAAVTTQTTASPLLPFGRRGGANRGAGAGAAGGARGGAGR